MTARQRLPNRRQCESREFSNGGLDFTLCAGPYLQFGADLETIRAALTKDHDGGPATLLGAALDALAEGAS